MRNIKLQLIVGLVILCTETSVALACAFVFPWQLLDNREETLDKMPVEEHSFAWAEAHAFPSSKDKLIAVDERRLGRTGGGDSRGGHRTVFRSGRGRAPNAAGDYRR